MGLFPPNILVAPSAGVVDEFIDPNAEVLVDVSLDC